MSLAFRHYAVYCQKVTKSPRLHFLSESDKQEHHCKTGLWVYFFNFYWDYKFFNLFSTHYMWKFAFLRKLNKKPLPLYLLLYIFRKWQKVPIYVYCQKVINENIISKQAFECIFWFSFVSISFSTFFIPLYVIICFLKEDN